VQAGGGCGGCSAGLTYGPDMTSPAGLGFTGRSCRTLLAGVEWQSGVSAEVAVAAAVAALLV
jgi:hypothetical protein